MTTLQEQLDAAVARAEAAESLLIDCGAMTSGTAITGLPACVVYAHELHCSPETFRRSAETALHQELEQLDDDRLSKAHGLAAELLAAADREVQQRSIRREVQSAE